ncbi:siderophore ABC transporter substrate-binding protein [Paenibacillus ginsengarvi]|uniref:Siderophore ABC transporter substrate-binding protein n=1 Tax=Paenibacillus ginsengarvi TaxID=400777 RepID=A0A3B0C021_9BACL|nr:siderophore ABC transporter substrate-binding protein [Paenibacillus ginsengarvi]RKN79165.1 siderophore ABC transporter substrate-binding protein [Paenibacillus ginsengarvi]
MKKNSWMLALLLVFVLIVSACGNGSDNQTTGGAAPATSGDSNAAQTPAQPAELTIKHKLGETKVKKNPQKVVVFDYGVLDSLDRLGVEVTGVPQASIPPYLAKYKDAKYKNVGSLVEADFEKVSAIKPDLIIISGRLQTAYEELSKIGPTIFLGVDNAKYLETYTENAKTLGQIFGKESQVDTELAKVNETVKTVSAKIKANGKNALIILANEGAISAYGAGSRFGIIHDVLGFTPVDPGIEVSTHGKPVSFEYIAEKNPDYLFIVDRGAAVGGESAAKKTIENELVKKTKAFKDGNIVYLDQNYWYLSGGGLISVSEMVKEIEKSVK